MNLRNFYMVVRAGAYLLTLPGVYLYLMHRHDADSTLMGRGLMLIMAGFCCFFVSYALRIWMAVRRKAVRAERFRTVLKDPDPVDAQAPDDKPADPAP